MTILIITQSLITVFSYLLLLLHVKVKFLSGGVQHVRAVVPLEQDALRRQPVDMGRRLPVVTVAAHVIGPQAVHADQDHIPLPLRHRIPQ